MLMGGGFFARPSVATIVVAADGSGDFTDIQSAINALPSGGGVVYVREGTYNVSVGIKISSSNIALMGAGRSTIIRATADCEHGIIDIDGRTATISGIIIADLAIDGNNTDSHGIMLRDDESNLFGVEASIVRNVWVYNCNFYGIFDAQLGSAKFNLFDSNVVHDILLNGICAYSGGANIMNNVSYANGGAGITIQTSDGAIVTDNRVYNNGIHGIWNRSANDSIISNNRVYNNSQNANNTSSEIWIEYGADNCVINGNVVYCRAANKAKYCIRIESAACMNNIVTCNYTEGGVTGNISDAGTGTIVANNQEI